MVSGVGLLIGDWSRKADDSLTFAVAAAALLGRPLVRVAPPSFAVSFIVSDAAVVFTDAAAAGRRGVEMSCK